MIRTTTQRCPADAFGNMWGEGFRELGVSLHVGGLYMKDQTIQAVYMGCGFCALPLLLHRRLCACAFKLWRHRQEKISNCRVVLLACSSWLQCQDFDFAPCAVGPPAEVCSLYACMQTCLVARSTKVPNCGRLFAFKLLPIGFGSRKLRLLSGDFESTAKPNP